MIMISAERIRAVLTLSHCRESSEYAEAGKEKLAGGESVMRSSRISTGEISAACQEQAQGIDQINKEVINMDNVVQKNASNAEESASAS